MAGPIPLILLNRTKCRLVVARHLYGGARRLHPANWRTLRLLADASCQDAPDTDAVTSGAIGANLPSVTLGLLGRANAHRIPSPIFHSTGRGRIDPIL